MLYILKVAIFISGSALLAILSTKQFERHAIHDAMKRFPFASCMVLWADKPDWPVDGWNYLPDNAATGFFANSPTNNVLLDNTDSLWLGAHVTLCSLTGKLDKKQLQKDAYDRMDAREHNENQARRTR